MVRQHSVHHFVSRSSVALGVAVGVLMVAPIPARSQSATVGVDAALRSRYEWRGLRLHDGPVVQSDAFLSIGRDAARLTVGAWGNAELGRANRADAIALGRRLFGEINAWGEVAAVIGPFDLAVGWTGYFYDLDGARGLPTELENTHELYGRLALTELPVVVPKMAVFYDVDAYRGAYAEAGLTLRVPLWAGVVVPVGSIFLDATAGYSLGQELDPAAPGRPGRYADRGLTHVDFSASLPVGAIPLGFMHGVLNAEIHVQKNHDPNTRLVDGLGEVRSLVVWFGASVTLLGPRCNPTRAICRG